MQILQNVAGENQAESQTDNCDAVLSARKNGVEIVRSVALASEFFHGPKPGRCFPVMTRAWRYKVATR